MPDRHDADRPGRKIVYIYFPQPAGPKDRIQSSRLTCLLPAIALHYVYKMCGTIHQGRFRTFFTLHRVRKRKKILSNIFRPLPSVRFGRKTEYRTRSGSQIVYVPEAMATKLPSSRSDIPDIACDAAEKQTGKPENIWDVC